MKFFTAVAITATLTIGALGGTVAGASAPGHVDTLSSLTHPYLVAHPPVVVPVVAAPAAVTPVIAAPPQAVVVAPVTHSAPVAPTVTTPVAVSGPVAPPADPPAPTTETSCHVTWTVNQVDPTTGVSLVVTGGFGSQTESDCDVVASQYPGAVITQVTSPVTYGQPGD